MFTIYASLLSKYNPIATCKERARTVNTSFIQKQMVVCLDSLINHEHFQKNVQGSWYFEYYWVPASCKLPQPSLTGKHIKTQQQIIKSVSLMEKDIWLSWATDLIFFNHQTMARSKLQIIRLD